MLKTPWLRTSLVLVLLVVSSFALAGPDAGQEPSEQDSSGCTFSYVEDLGPACRISEEVWKVKHRDGTYGYTHGGDPVPDDPVDSGFHLLGHGDPRPPVCASSPGTDYHHVLIYARAHDDDDRYSTIAPQLRDLIHDINGHLYEEAQTTGDVTVDYRFHCTSGDVTVFDESLPTAKADADFDTIVSDLRDKGYDSHRGKYWVWYDDQDACSCAGTGHVYNDDRLTEDNWNNGRPDAVSMYGVTFGYLNSQGHRTMMHENAHNMGAVQGSAPNASPGGFHCNDGQDIMCYDDSGSDPSQYDPNVCTDYERFDCEKNDYFHPDPPGGHYLSSHWNLGSTLNRFLVIDLGKPVMEQLHCSPSPSIKGEEVTCSIAATAQTDEVHYDVDWGDGTSSRVPATGTVPAGSTETALHTWDTEGNYTIQVTATDTGNPPLTSDPKTRSHEVLFAQTPVAVADADPERDNMDATFTFDGSDSQALIGTIASYQWRQDGDVVSEQAVHTSGFTSTGEHCLELTVTDDDARTDTDTACIWVNNPPEAVATASPGLAVTGDDVTFDGSGSSDPDGTIASHQWTRDGDVVSDQPVYKAAFATTGEHCLMLRVSDHDGATDTAQVCVDVIEPPQPIAEATRSPSVQNLGHPVTFDGSDSDPQDPTGSGLSFQWTEAGTPVSTQETFDRNFSVTGDHCLKLTVKNPWSITDDDTACVEIFDTYKVSAQPTQDSFVPTNPPLIDVWVKTVADQNVQGARVEIEVRYAFGNETLDGLLHTVDACPLAWNATAHTTNGFHRFTVPPALERCLGAELPGELLTLGDGRWQVKVVATQYGNEGEARTSYQVGQT